MHGLGATVLAAIGAAILWVCTGLCKRADAVVGVLLLACVVLGYAAHAPTSYEQAAAMHTGTLRGHWEPL